jgi:hypothetical protein
MPPDPGARITTYSPIWQSPASFVAEGALCRFLNRRGDEAERLVRGREQRIDLCAQLRTAGALLIEEDRALRRLHLARSVE